LDISLNTRSCMHFCHFLFCLCIF